MTYGLLYLILENILFFRIEGNYYTVVVPRELFTICARFSYLILQK